MGLCIGPRPSHQGKGCHHHQDGGSKHQRRFDQPDGAFATGLPNHHLAVGIHARQSRDRGDVQSHGDNGVQITKHGVAKHQRDFTRIDIAARGLTQCAYQQHRHHNADQNN